MHNFKDDDIDILEEILRNAGKKLLEYFTKKISIKIKSDHSFVTEADLASEKIILDSLKKAFPHDITFSEEEGCSSFERKEGKRIWIIDPLDGTTNFVHHYPFFCISIAQGRFDKNSRIEIERAGIFDPMHDDLYLAKKSSGAFCNDQLLGPVLEEHLELDRYLLSTGLHCYSEQQKYRTSKVYQNVFNFFKNIRNDGSAALDLALVAKKVYHGYFSYGLKPWDMAAGVLLIKEANGIVSNQESLDFFDIESPSIIAGIPSVYQKLKQLIHN